MKQKMKTKQKLKLIKKDIHSIAERLRKTSEYNRLVDGRAEWWDGYIKGKEEEKNKILSMINKDRDNGNMENIMTNGKKFIEGFSPALCLSKIIKYCEKTEGKEHE